MDIVNLHQPYEFYNLAAQSYVGGSWRLAHVTTDVDAIGPLNCLEAIRRFAPHCKFYQAGTSEMFGNSNDDGWQSETTHMMPRSPYGVAKLYGYHITRNMRESYNMFACTGILFNHESPLRGIDFVTRKISAGVADIVSGEKRTIDLGNLDAERDWGFAGDYVEAMWLMLQQDNPVDYVCATGKVHSVREVCRTAFNHVGVTDWQAYVYSKDTLIRPAEVNYLRGDSSKITKELGWKPKVEFHELITRMVDNDMGKPAK
jgi:GDPmannose 4,6-dehydratase